MHRHHAGLRRQRCGVGRGRDAEFDVARFHQLQDLRFLPELRAGILVNQHGALAQFLELVAEDIAEDSVTRGFRLVIGEAIMLDLLRISACGHHDRGCDRDRTENPFQIAHCLPCRNVNQASVR